MQTFCPNIFLEFVEDVIKKYGKPTNAYYDNAETVLGQSMKKRM